MLGTFEILAEATLTEKYIFLVGISFLMQFALACLLAAVVDSRLIKKQKPIMSEVFVCIVLVIIVRVRECGFVCARAFMSMRLCVCVHYFIVTNLRRSV